MTSLSAFCELCKNSDLDLGFPEHDNGAGEAPVTDPPVCLSPASIHKDQTASASFIEVYVSRAPPISVQDDDEHR
jgi:hypothetical protein